MFVTLINFLLIHLFTMAFKKSDLTVNQLYFKTSTKSRLQFDNSNIKTLIFLLYCFFSNCLTINFKEKKINCFQERFIPILIREITLKESLKNSQILAQK